MKHTAGEDARSDESDLWKERILFPAASKRLDDGDAKEA